MSVTCPKCGDQNPDGTRFCAGCGEYLAWERRDAEDDTRRPQPAEPPLQEQHAELAVSLSGSPVACTPGERVSTTVTVRNRGTRVERAGVVVEGGAAPYATVVPEELVIQPDDAAEYVVTFAPPRSSSVRAGTVGFTVRARSQINSGITATAEGQCVVAGFDDLSVELSPKDSRGWWMTHHMVVFANRGNLTHRVRIRAEDDENELRFSRPAGGLVIPPGHTELALRVWAKPGLTGPAREIPFATKVDVDDGAKTIRVDGTRTVLPLVTSWPLRTVVLVLALLIVAAVAIGALLNARERAILDQETYLAGSGTLSNGLTSVETPRLPDEARIFVTPDLSQGPLAETQPGWLPFAGALGVTGRGWTSFSVQPLDGSNMDGTGFNYLIVRDSSGTLNGQSYEAGSGSVQPGERQVSVPATMATSRSVILLTVETDGSLADPVAGLRVDAKNDGAFTVATLDLVPAPVEIRFSWLVIDSDDSSLAGVETTTFGDPARIDTSVENGVVLLTTDVANNGLSGSGATGVYVDDQSDDAFSVAGFSGPAVGFDYLIVERRE
ncbi:zinc-ribbon domain-containing protein [Nonomuraea sp. ZG12]|uniref:zinc-ribbon domain-containing protein n=1 Tax=Nonomuraea sp. ZG12 TaxID=3452207 RepID=UPI003F88BFD2